jgi:hypothetical protein
MTPWILYLDDIRIPGDNPFHEDSVYSDLEWTIARSSAEAKDLIILKGMPLLISFDHDLGGDDTAMRFLSWLTREYWDGVVSPPDFRIHSANPVGRLNILSFMQSWIRTASFTD